jgi:hypothetical protein
LHNFHFCLQILLKARRNHLRSKCLVQTNRQVWLHPYDNFNL